MNITPTDTRDVRGLSTFHGFNLQKLFFPGSTLTSNYYKMSVYPVRCCSPHSITFKVLLCYQIVGFMGNFCVVIQVADHDKMYSINYLLYTLQLFESGVLGNVPATTTMPEANVSQYLHYAVKKFLFILERNFPSVTRLLLQSANCQTKF